MQNILSTVSHRPWALPAGRWRMAQRWNDLLFAHWPIPPDEIATLLPAGLEVDTFDNQAWVGVVPFRMDQVRTRSIGDRCITIPSTGSFCDMLSDSIQEFGSEGQNSRQENQRASAKADAL